MIIPKPPTTQDGIQPLCPADPPAATAPHIVQPSTIPDWLTTLHSDHVKSHSHSHLRAQPRYVTYHLEALGNTTTTRFWTRERPLIVPPQPRTQASLSFCQFLPFGSLVTRYAGQEEASLNFRTSPQQAFLQTNRLPANPKNKTHQRTSNMPFFYSKPIGGKNFGTSVHADRHGIRRGPWRFRIGRFNCFR
ncbi:hypothetical protein CGLO_06227 [Colletotrichum gloeosporioides Cg-14]|uniref:Uncharacterized protein n=1 Tax=Colletotrichum gloeosporioides (strain Cg-14) TaxID=1237896 RepID=T0KPZ2_COLGC|nr:hypothetical protein CGLO_06227 [Colletotrichum gloeosporioides Cg-14]